MGYLQWSAEAVPVKNKWIRAVFSSSATPDAYCQADLLPWLITLLSILLREFKNMFMLNGYFVVGWSNCQCVQQKGAHLLPIMHTGTGIQIIIIFFSPILSSSGCVYNISVVIIRYLARVIWCAQRSIKRLCSDLSCCLCVIQQRSSPNTSESQETHFLWVYIRLWKSLK